MRSRTAPTQVCGRQDDTNMKVGQKSDRPRVRCNKTAVIAALEGRMAAGVVCRGALLPSVRMISRDTGCAPLTAYRALRDLTQRGIVVAERGRGYRVAGGPVPGTEIVALLEDTEHYAESLGEIYATQLRTLQRETMLRHWTFALVPYRRQSAEEITGQLRQVGATALLLQDILDDFPRELLEHLGRSGLPVVSLDEPYGVAGIDHVLRDEAQGAALAAEYLIGRGHRRIGWYGRLHSVRSSRRRFAGAAEVLLREGVAIDRQGWRDVVDADQVEVAREYLRRRNRPKAVLALSASAALALAQAAQEDGIRLGIDLDVAGWCLDELFEKAYASVCPDLATRCAAVGWSMADVGRAVLDRIEEQRRKPVRSNVSVLLPMTLRTPTISCQDGAA